MKFYTLLTTITLAAFLVYAPLSDLAYAKFVLFSLFWIAAASALVGLGYYIGSVLFDRNR